NTQARKITISTNFLEKGKKYTVKIYQDDDKVQTLTKVGIIERKIKGGEVMSFNLKASGGVALYIVETTKN
ncbi:MAG TPA: glycoside hydrolase family 97 C-terminal domain-containing protein, partial [Paludibacter sp.]|nr:glycoside hydrolase family 97 C-terminal domain-containing protein [Paludibacter sp.]